MKFLNENNWEIKKWLGDPDMQKLKKRLFNDLYIYTGF